MFRISTTFVVCLGVVGVAWVLGGIFIIYLGVARVSAGFGSQNWPHVQGQVTKSEMFPIKNSDGTPAFYHVKIEYTYLPASETFPCNNSRLSTLGFIDPADDSYSLAGASHFLARYPVGKAVTVYHERANPMKSTLRPGTDVGTYSGSMMGAVSLLLGTTCLWFIALLGSKGKPRVTAVHSRGIA
jgi:hypothetical protein